MVPGFEGIENPGVYRVARVGGTPERIYTTRPTEQFTLVNDDDGILLFVSQEELNIGAGGDGAGGKT